MRKRRTRTSREAVALVAVSLIAALSTVGLAVTGQNDESVERETTIARNLIERLIERYESESSYRILFTQESYWALADTSVQSNGVLLLERPSNLSVVYDDGSSIVSNGDTLWVYMAETNQYFATDIGADDTVIDPPRVLRQYVPDPNDPYTGPDQTDGIESAASAVTSATLFLVPAEGTGEPARLEVQVDPSRTLVTGMSAHTRSGDTTSYSISDTRFGVETDPTDFTFEAPPGAERIGG